MIVKIIQKELKRSRGTITSLHWPLTGIRGSDFGSCIRGRFSRQAGLKEVKSKPSPGPATSQRVFDHIDLKDPGVVTSFQGRGSTSISIRCNTEKCQAFWRLQKANECSRTTGLGEMTPIHNYRYPFGPFHVPAPPPPCWGVGAWRLKTS